MRIPRWGACLLGVGCLGFEGCSQTGWLRPNSPTDAKITASVNGKPVTTAAVEPASGTGTALREEIDDVDPPPAAGSRISGRVFDKDGRAVPNAKVRLGVGGSAGGRVNFATTDRSGAFTLHGLRPGVSYTVIAEYQGEDGMMSGRVQARAPETGVRIALGARDPAFEAEPRGAKILPARVRSTLFPDEDNDTDGFPAMARPRVPAPAEDQPDREPAEGDTPALSTRLSRSSAPRLASATTSGPIRAGWIVRQRQSAASTDRSRPAADADDPRNGPPAPEARPGDDDDGENPLPPALEPEEPGPSQPAARRVGSAAIGRDDVRSASMQRASRARQAAPATDDDLSSTDRDSRSYGSAPRPIPEDALPPSTGIAQASGEEVDATAQRPASPRRRPRTAASRPRDDDPASPADSSQTDESSEDNPPPARSTRRPTWRELSISPENVPVDEALRRSSGEEVEDDPGTVIRAGGPSHPDDDQAVRPEVTADAPTRPRRARRSAGSPVAARRPSPSAARSDEPICRLDPSHRRIIDLQLPGLDGNMVSLRDIDADFILLDFWGSWCRECGKSIDHHREIQQQQLGGKTLQVIGVACEKASTFEGRRDAAIAAARKLGINYPVLLTTMDGACPVQRALQVQFYPTMILLDREGHIVQFEQGATDTTLGRIDRAIATAVRDGGRRGQ